MTQILRALAFAGTLLAAGAAQAADFTISSTDASPDGALDQPFYANGFGCTGGDISPQISWRNAPKDTKSFVVTMYDPDAPSGSGWWHWVAFNIPASVSDLPRGSGSEGGKMPAGATVTNNDAGQLAYLGPCPPEGQTHRYIFTVKALKVDKLDLPANASGAMVGYISNKNSLGEATLTLKADADMKRDDGGGVRLIHTRAGVGATAGVIQREALRFTQITIDQPTLILVRHGLKTLASSSREWVIRSGEAVAIAAGQRFDVTNHPDARGAYEASWLVFEPPMLASMPSALVPATQTACALGPVEADFMEAYIRARDAIRDPGRIPDAIARHRMREVLLWIEGRGVSLVASPPRTCAERVRAVLMSTLDETWTAAMVARHLHMSEPTLRRHLAVEGTSLTDLLADMRMSHALTLLQSTDYPVGHIAQDVGYDSASRFAIRFRKRFGFAPTAVRGHRREDIDAKALALPL